MKSHEESPILHPKFPCTQGFTWRFWGAYPLVIAMEDGHRNSWFTYWTWWFSPIAACSPRSLQVNKLNGQLQRTEQQAQQATVKKNREGRMGHGPCLMKSWSFRRDTLWKWLRVCYWTLPFVVDLRIKNGDYPLENMLWNVRIFLWIYSCGGWSGPFFAWDHWKFRSENQLMGWHHFLFGHGLRLAWWIRTCRTKKVYPILLGSLYNLRRGKHLYICIYTHMYVYIYICTHTHAHGI